jgi:signal transduction histidine kinase
VTPFTFASRQWAYVFGVNPLFTTKPAGEGTGLGLSISHDVVVKQHGGTIDIEAQANEFTEFIVTLPRQAIE